MFLDFRAHSFPSFLASYRYKLVKPHLLEKLVSKRERRKEGREREEERRRKEGREEEGSREGREGRN